MIKCNLIKNCSTCITHRNKTEEWQCCLTSGMLDGRLELMSDEVSSLLATTVTQHASSICIHTHCYWHWVLLPPPPPFSQSLYSYAQVTQCVCVLMWFHTVEKKMCHYSLMVRNSTQQWFWVLPTLMELHLQNNLFCIHANRPLFPLQLPHTSDPSLTCACL